MSIDTTYILQEIDSTQEHAYARSQGIANLASFKDFSREQRAFITTIAEKYQQETEALQLGHSIFERLSSVIHIDTWRIMSERNIEFLEKLQSATTYEEWEIVFTLAEEWFRLMREIVQDDKWTELLNSSSTFFQRITELGGMATLPVLSVPDSMIATIDREITETRAGQSVFVPEVIVATKMILAISEEEPI